MIKTTVPETLDQLDMRLIGELESDARQNYLDLAAKLETTPKTISRRFKRLLDEHVIRIVAAADPAALGYRTRAGIGINARPDKINAIASHLATFQKVNHIVATTGRYDLIAWISLEDSDDLLDFVTQDLGSIPDVANTETLIILKSIKNQWRYFTDQNGRLPTNQLGASVHIDELDRALIRELEIDPRQPVQEIAGKLGIGRTRVSSRLQTLIENRVIRIVANLHPFSLGYTTRSILLVKVHPSSIRDVADTVARYRHVAHVDILSGSFDLFISAVFRNSEEIYQFTSDELGRIPGVIRCESMIVVKFVKNSFALLAGNIKQEDMNKESGFD